MVWTQNVRLLTRISGSAGCSILFFRTPDSLCANGDDEKRKPFPSLQSLSDIGIPIKALEISKESALPIATSLGFGTMAGYSCGYSLKKVGKAATGVFGGLFVLFQVKVLWLEVPLELFDFTRFDHNSTKLCYK